MGIKDYFTNLYVEAKEVLDKYEIASEDKQIIKDAYGNAVYQAIMLNSSYRAFEETVMEEVGKDKYEEIVKHAIHNGKTEHYMQEFMPDFIGEEPEE